MTKPWWQSLTLKGAVTAGIGVAASPAILDVLPPKWANGVATVGAVAAMFGLRRALPNTPRDP